MEFDLESKHLVFKSSDAIPLFVVQRHLSVKLSLEVVDLSSQHLRVVFQVAQLLLQVDRLSLVVLCIEFSQLIRLVGLVMSLLIAQTASSALLVRLAEKHSVLVLELVKDFLVLVESLIKLL